MALAAIGQGKLRVSGLVCGIESERFFELSDCFIDAILAKMELRENHARGCERRV